VSLLALLGAWLLLFLLGYALMLLPLTGDGFMAAVLVDASVAVTGAQLTEPGIRVAYRALAFCESVWFVA
jgi:hypothetical protein